MNDHTIRLEEVFPEWKKLTPEQQRDVRAAVTERHCHKGELLHQGSNDCSGLFLVRSGQLRVFILSSGGKEITLYRLFERDICLFSASCIMKNISFDLHVEAEKDSDIWIIPPDVYDRLLKNSLPVMEYTSGLMASRFSDVVWIMEQVLFTSFSSRLASFLLEQNAVEDSSLLHITHEEIARHLGSAREVVTKMLRYLAEERLVRLSRGKIELLDTKRLRNLVE